MLKNDKGFSMIEALIASSIIFMMISTFIPINTILSTERSRLSDQRIFTSRLHDELQPFLWNTDQMLPQSLQRQIKATSVNFYFSLEDKLIKGCAEWKNVKEINENICLYGYPKK